MTGISLPFEFDAESARRRLRDMIDRMDDRLFFFREVGQILADSARENFRREAGPDGRPWVPLSPATIRARKKRSKSALAILRDSGRLAGSINFRATNDEARVGAVPEYAAIHQLGGTIEKPERTALVWRKRERNGTIGRRFARKKLKTSVATGVTIPAHTITIPARPYLGVSAQDQVDIFEAAERWLAR